jgi:hypothetical protein
VHVRCAAQRGRYDIGIDADTAISSAENETELSFFNRQAYEAFKANPEVSSLHRIVSSVLNPALTPRASLRSVCRVPRSDSAVSLRRLVEITLHSVSV